MKIFIFFAEKKGKRTENERKEKNTENKTLRKLSEKRQNRKKDTFTFSKCVHFFM